MYLFAESIKDIVTKEHQRERKEQLHSNGHVERFQEESLKTT